MPATSIYIVRMRIHEFTQYMYLKCLRNKLKSGKPFLLMGRITIKKNIISFIKYY